MKEITHLVVNGCSWTYCQGLDDPTTQGWPALVAKELGIDVVNIAIPGSGNGSIHRRTYEYVFRNIPTGTKPFFIIGWSQLWRQEAWYKTLDNEPYNYYRGIHVVTPSDIELDEHELALLSHWDDEDHFRKTILNKASLKALFLSHDISYMMGDFSGTPEDHESWNNYKHLVKNEIDFIYDKNYAEPFYNKTCKFPKLPCGHDGPDAQVALANYIVDKIKNSYNLNITPNNGYVRARDMTFERAAITENCWRI